MHTSRPLLMALTVFVCLGSAAAMTIAEDGRPVAAIVLPAQATPTERFAAEELQRYLRAISGAELAIAGEADGIAGPRLLIGRTEAATAALTDLGADEPEAFVVRTVGEDLLLAGASDRATRYAVYDFLERDLGCRWLGPGPAWEVVPERATIQIGPLDRTERPAMKYRLLHITRGGEPGSWQAQCLDWAVKQRINVATGWPLEELPESFAQRGGFRAWMSPHVLGHALDPEEHFAEHPEWYALRHGARLQAERSGFQQVCTTNPEVVAAVIAELRRTLDARPDTDFIGLGQGDGVNFCECPRCLALDTGEIWPGSDGTGSAGLPVITERWLSFVNEVARGLQRTHPGKGVYTLAYHQTFRPPDPAVIGPEPNVLIQVVNSRPNYVCFMHRFEAEGCTHHERFREGLRRWVAMTPGGVMLYEYVVHSTFASMPYAAPHKFVDDIRYLAREGVVGYDGQSVDRLWGTYGIIHYAIAKASWDPEVDADALVRDYCDHAFGAASAPMQAFYATIEAALEAAEHSTDGVWAWMTAENMARARTQLDAAHAAADGDAARTRLRTIEVGFHYGELGAEAWRTAQAAIAAQDAAGLRRAIDLAQQAAQYVNDEQERAPHYAALPGKLLSVHVVRWQNALAKLEER